MRRSIFIVLGISLIVTRFAQAQMSSTNYKILLDSINVGGIETSTSTNFKSIDTLGEVETDLTTSTNFSGISGFRRIEANSIFTLLLSDTAIALGDIKNTAVATGQLTLTVTTNALRGYTLTVSEDGALRGAGSIPEVDGTVVAGEKKYGIATSKSGQGIAQDTNCVADPFTISQIGTLNRTVSASSTPVENDTTTVCLAASTDGSLSGGSYTHLLTFTGTGNF